ncbi:hypothetical protein CYMTET_52949 [Cymbomonas tetramitiformis]|uniref:S1 motif domain-containing protein n=1 Tax=Cymbomonas tetramitiformis TaxID=36881 RepID=A0AAE0BI88_9CHLO|nr:hypothetical protein CYMTET_52949 [Cymbomonas tetramitiformis]
METDGADNRDGMSEEEKYHPGDSPSGKASSPREERPVTALDEGPVKGVREDARDCDRGERGVAVEAGIVRGTNLLGIGVSAVKEAGGGISPGGAAVVKEAGGERVHGGCAVVVETVLTGVGTTMNEAEVAVMGVAAVNENFVRESDQDIRRRAIADHPLGVPFGIFVQLDGYRRDGLVHNTQVDDMLSFAREDPDDDKVKAMEWAAPSGKKVWVKVVEVRTDNADRLRIGCSMKVVNQEDGTDLDPNNEQSLPSAPGAGGGGGAPARGPRGGPRSDEPPELNAVLRATVQQIKPFGIFVEMEGFGRWGMVHRMQVANFLEFNRDDPDEDKIAAMAGVVSQGERVYVKVVEVNTSDDGRLKIGCSMKVVDQNTGEDMDPNNTQCRPRGDGGQGKLGEDAGETTKTGVINWSHHAGDVKQMGDGNYDILDEDPEENQPKVMQVPPPPPLPEAKAQITSVEQALAILAKAEKHKKKSKKEKKEKKDKKSKKSKKAKKEKKEKKSRKKEDASDSSDSDSD